MKEQSKAIDWKELRESYFNECVESKEGETPKVTIHPHNLFEWFKSETQEYISSSKVITDNSKVNENLLKQNKELKEITEVCCKPAMEKCVEYEFEIIELKEENERLREASKILCDNSIITKLRSTLSNAEWRRFIKETIK